MTDLDKALEELINSNVLIAYHPKFRPKKLLFAEDNLGYILGPSEGKLSMSQVLNVEAHQNYASTIVIEPDGVRLILTDNVDGPQPYKPVYRIFLERDKMPENINYTSVSMEDFLDKKDEINNKFLKSLSDKDSVDSSDSSDK